MKWLSYRTDVGARVDDYVDDKKEAVKSTVTGVSDKVTGVVPDCRQLSTVKDTAERNPLGLGVGGVAVGFVAGAPAAVDERRERADGRDLRSRRGRGQGHSGGACRARPRSRIRGRRRREGNRA
jgi:hypothetical protein